MKQMSGEKADIIETENLVNTDNYMQSKRIAETLKMRSNAGLPFTYVGDILLAVNPDPIRNSCNTLVCGF